MTQIEEKDDKEDVKYKFRIYGHNHCEKFMEYFDPEHFSLSVLKPVSCEDVLQVMVFYSHFGIDSATIQDKESGYDVMVDPNHYCWPKLAKLGVVDGDHIDIESIKGHIVCLILANVVENLLAKIKRDSREYEIDKEIKRFDKVKSDIAKLQKTLE